MLLYIRDPFCINVAIAVFTRNIFLIVLTLNFKKKKINWNDNTHMT